MIYNKKRHLTHFLIVLLFAGLMFSCSKKQYVVSNIDGTRVLMDSTWENKVSANTRSLVDKYKSQLDKQMNEVVGNAAQTMKGSTPQSLLTNLTSDVMKQYGEQYSGKPVDFALCNVHGLRATLTQGPVTVGNLFEIYSFDNLLVVLDLDGKAVKELFKYYASNEGEGVSSNVQLKIKNKKISSLEIDGKPVNDDQIYRISTLDYLADGNSGMSALKKATKTFATGVTLRDVMIDYVKKCTAEGKKIDSKLDNRIVIEK